MSDQSNKKKNYDPAALQARQAEKKPPLFPGKVLLDGFYWVDPKNPKKIGREWKATYNRKGFENEIKTISFATANANAA